jgi:hypothetical protein
MKKGQGAKSRSSFLEAMKGPSAEGIVGFFIAKQHFRETVAFEIDAFKNLSRLTVAQKGHLKMREGQLAVLDNEIAHIVQHAPKEYPGFLENLAIATKIKAPVYPADVRMLEAYTRFRYLEPIEKMTLEEMETKPAPPPAEVPYQRLFEATQDESGSPSASQFSRMVKQYPWMILTREKPGRKAYVKR